MQHYVLRGVSLGAMILSAPVYAAVSDDAALSGAEQGLVDRPYEEIVVTANKREQSIYDVASSLTSIGVSAIEARGISDLRGLVQEVPGLSFFSRGNAGANLIILRGLSSGSSTISPTVGFYVNDTPFGFSIPVGGGSSLLQPDLDPSDIERVEVLRGPQGTLYGASTLGGLIKYVTKKPDPSQPGGSVQLTGVSVAHGGFGHAARGAVNLPVVTNRIALRLSAFSRLDPGFIDNVRTGQHNVNRVHAYGGRASLGLYPNDDLSIVLSGLYQKNDNRALGVVNLARPSLAPMAGDLTQLYYINTTFDSAYRLADVQIEWQAGDYVISSSTSFGRAELLAKFDFTGLFPAEYLGATYYVGPQDLRYEKFSQELRLASPAERPFEWVAGFYYTTEDVRTRTSVDGYTADGQPAPLVPTVSRSATDADYREIAGFANLTYNFTPQLSLTGGVRLAHSKITDEIRTGGALSGVPLDEPIIQNGRQSDKVTTYLAALNWRYADRGSLFLRAASGYRPGGPIEPPPVLAPGQTIPTEFFADTVWNFEVGNRSTLLDGLLTAQVSAFYIRWTDIQLPFLVNGIRVLSNGGRARSQGFEFETRLNPTKGLDLALLGSYTDAELTSPAPLVFGRTGDRLPYVPRWNITASADYEHPVSSSVTAKLGGTFHYQSGINTALSPLDSTFIAFGGFSTVDLRASLSWGRFELTGFMRNLFDKRAYVSGGTSGGLPAGIPIQPRTIGLGIRASF